MSNSSFTQKITLEGGDQIQKSLLDIGEAGKKAFDQIGKSANDVGKGDATQGLDRIRDALSELIDVAGAFGKSLTGGLTLAAGAMTGISAGLSAIGVAAADSTNKLVESAKKLGTSTEQLQRLTFAANSAGIGDGELATALGKIKTQFDEASKGAKSYFRHLGDIGSASKQFDAGTGIGVLRGGAQGDDAGKTSVNFRSLASSGNDYLKTLQNLGEALARIDDDDPRKKSITDDLEKKFGKDFTSKIEDLGKEIRTTSEVYNSLGLSVTDTDKAISKANEESLSRLKLNLTEQKTIISATVGAIGHDLAMLFTPGATANQDAISDFIETHRLDIVNFVKDDVLPAMTLLKTVISAAGDGVGAAFGAGIDVAKRGWAAFKALISSNDLSSFQGWKNAALNAFDGIAAFASATFLRVVDYARAAYAGMKDAALSAFPSLVGAFSAMESGVAAIMERLKQVSGTTWLEIGAGMLAFSLLFSTSFASLALAAIPFWSEILDGAAALAPGLRLTIAPIRAAAGEMFGSVSSLGKAAFDAIKALLSGDAQLQATAFDALKLSARSLWAEIEAGFVAGYGWIRAQTVGAASWMAEPWQMLEQAVADSWAWVKTQQQSGWQSIKGVWDGLVSTWKAVESGANSVAWVLNKVFGSELTGKQLLLIGAFLQFTGVLGPVLALVTAVATVFDLLALAIGVAMIAFDHPAITTFLGSLVAIYMKTGDLAQVFAKVKEALGGLFGGPGVSAGMFTAEIAKLVLGLQSFFGVADTSSEHFRDGQKKTLDDVKKDHEESTSFIGRLWKELGVGSAGAAGIDKQKLPQVDIGDAGNEALRMAQQIAAVFARIGADVQGLFALPAKTATAAATNAGGFFDRAKSLFSGGSSLPSNFKSVGGGNGGGFMDWINSLFGGNRGGAVPNSKRAPAEGELPQGFQRTSYHETDAEARERDAANRYFNQPVIGKRALDASVGANDQYVSEGAMKRSVDRNMGDFPVYPGYLPKKGDQDEQEGAENLTGAIRSTSSALGDLVDKVRQFGASLSGKPSGASSPGFADGGHVTGSGTGTSDSILARLSNGEFIINAKTVAALGPRFFHALNNMDLPGFAMGGLVMEPAFASGGMVSGLSAPSSSSEGTRRVGFSLDLFGQSFHGLSGPQETLDALERHSAALQMAATSKRAPSRVR